MSDSPSNDPAIPLPSQPVSDNAPAEYEASAPVNAGIQIPSRKNGTDTTSDDDNIEIPAVVSQAENDRRFLLIAGSIFLVVMTGQYVMIVLDRPQPLPWTRGEAFQFFRVDVNHSTWAEWIQLKGIGQGTAMRIVADRELNGPFTSIEDVGRVEGIGPATLDRIRPWLTMNSEQPKERSRDSGKTLESNLETQSQE